jgi:hypothetical protein
VATILLRFCRNIFPGGLSAVHERIDSVDDQRVIENPSTGDCDFVRLALVTAPIFVDFLCN